MVVAILPTVFNKEKVMAKKETREQRDTREGGENELAGSRSAMRIQRKLRQEGQARKARKDKR